MNATFIWEFDANNIDPLASNTQRSGFLANFVYDRPGVYEIEVHALDVAGRVGVSQRHQITVLDPEVVFMPPNGRTVCVALPTDPNFSGCPSSDPQDHVATANFPQAVALAAANRRILFRRGQQWSISQGGGTQNLIGPTQFSVYPQPYLRNGQRAQVVSSGSNWANFWSIGGSQNLYIGGIHATGPWTPGTSPLHHGIAISGGSNIHLDDIFGERVDGEFFYCGQAQGISITNSEVNYSRGYGAYVTSCPQFTFTDNTVTRLYNNQHGIRVQSGSRTLVSRNTFLDLIESFTSITIRGNHDKILVADNYLDVANGFSPQNDQSEEYVHHFVFENNISVPKPSEAWRGWGVGSKARNGVIRGNVFINILNPISLSDHPLVGGTENVDIYNNSAINTNTENAMGNTFAHVGAQARSIRIFNNLWMANDTTPWSRFLSTGNVAIAEISESHNIFYSPNMPANWQAYWHASIGGFTLSQWQTSGKGLGTLQVNPGFADTNPASATALTLLPQSPAVNSGQTTAIVYDLYGNSRLFNGTIDRGAVEYQP